MQQFGPEGAAPNEGGGGAASEQASEQARERFASSQAAGAQAQKDEQKSRKRDDGVAQVILQFLTDVQRTHFAVLIARLVSRDCPSIFLLSLLSLINKQCETAVEEYLREQNEQNDTTTVPTVPSDTALSPQANEALAHWIVRTERVMMVDQDTILRTLIVDDSNIDGTILQLTTFVLQDFLSEQGKNATFDTLQTLSAGILQTLFRPAMQSWKERRLTEEAPPEPAV